MKKFLVALFSFAMAVFLTPVFGAEVSTALGLATFTSGLVFKPSAVFGTNTVAARMVYENAKTAFRNAGVQLGTDALAQSFLRFELALATTKTQYQFMTLSNAGTVFNTEQRLNLQDSFVVSHIGIFIGKPASGTDTAFELDTYASSSKYTDAATAAATNAIFTSGIMSITVNNKILLPAWDLNRHFWRPITQLTAATNSPLDQKRLSEDGFYPVEPNVVMIGSKNSQIEIALPVALTAIVANSRVIVVCRGILAQNSTVVS